MRGQLLQLARRPPPPPPCAPPRPAASGCCLATGRRWHTSETHCHSQWVSGLRRASAGVQCLGKATWGVSLGGCCEGIADNASQGTWALGPEGALWGRGVQCWVLNGCRAVQLVACAAYQCRCVTRVAGCRPATWRTTCHVPTASKPLALAGFSLDDRWCATAKPWSSISRKEVCRGRVEASAHQGEDIQPNATCNFRQSTACPHIRLFIGCIALQPDAQQFIALPLHLESVQALL